MNEIQKGIYQVQENPDLAKLDPNTQSQIDETRMSLSELLS